jgi:hypothetical protein
VRDIFRQSTAVADGRVPRSVGIGCAARAPTGGSEWP